MKKNIVEKRYEIEWPGWSLKDNRYGKDFDAEARIRMIETGRKLLPYMLDYIDNLDKNYLEIGPFFTPLLFSEELTCLLPKDKCISFIDNDKDVVKWLKERFDCNVLNLDMNVRTFPNELKQKNIDQFGVFEHFYDVITISQILNYIDYKLLLKNMHPFLNEGGHIFINNVVDYGIPTLFSGKRPKSNQEIIGTAVSMGYKVALKEEIPKIFDEEQYQRLILILTK
ncbi:hypothetical protein [Maribacter sp. 2-571]|uniref:hypothetical protein n=1 Tax=Maribacter sp. 2-571 TaxID=3417569 RepID=UPI003D336507